MADPSSEELGSVSALVWAPCTLRRCRQRAAALKGWARPLCVSKGYGGVYCAIRRPEKSIAVVFEPFKPQDSKGVNIDLVLICWSAEGKKNHDKR